jgi:Domain of unknown function (DUF4464)
VWCSKEGGLLILKGPSVAQVLADSDEGLLFKSKWDRKTVSVNPAGVQGDNSTRIEIASPHYQQVVLYDHVLRCRG